MRKYVFYILFLNIVTSCQKKESLATLPPEPKEAHVKHEKNKPEITLQPVNQTTITPAASNPSDVSVKTLTATVIGTQTSQLSFRVSGYISDVLVRNGQYVKKGQVIAKLDNSIALQNLTLSKLALQQANTAQHFAELTLKRTQTLNQRQATTQIALEQAEAGFQNAQIAYKQAESNLKLAQINYEETNLIAPFEGYIFGLTSWVGTYVSSTTIIATLTSIHDLQIQIPIPQTITNNFAIGQEFSFSNSSQNVEGTLKITGIVPFVDANSKTYLLFASPVKVQGQLMAGELVVIDLK